MAVFEHYHFIGNSPCSFFHDEGNSMNDSAAEKAEAKPRNPVERIIVWGGIGILVVLVGFEAMARFGYTNSLNALQAKLAMDDAAEPVPLTLDVANKTVSGMAKREAGDNAMTYRFSGLLKEYGAIHLKLDDDNLVIGLETDGAEADAPVLPTAGPPIDPENLPEDPMTGPAHEEGTVTEPGSETEPGEGTEKPAEPTDEKSESPAETPAEPAEETEKPAEEAAPAAEKPAAPAEETAETE